MTDASFTRRSILALQTQKGAGLATRGRSATSRSAGAWIQARDPLPSSHERDGTCMQLTPHAGVPYRPPSLPFTPPTVSGGSSVRHPPAPTMPQLSQMLRLNRRGAWRGTCDGICFAPPPLLLFRPTRVCPSPLDVAGWNHTFGECWLRHLADPEHPLFGQRGELSAEYRLQMMRTRKGCKDDEPWSCPPTHVPWTSGTPGFSSYEPSVRWSTSGGWGNMRVSRISSSGEKTLVMVNGKPAPASAR